MDVTMPVPGDILSSTSTRPKNRYLLVPIRGPDWSAPSTVKARPSSSTSRALSTSLPVLKKSLNRASSFQLSPLGRVEKSNFCSVWHLPKAGSGSHLSPSVGSQSEKVCALARCATARARRAVERMVAAGFSSSFFFFVCLFLLSAVWLESEGWGKTIESSDRELAAVLDKLDVGVVGAAQASSGGKETWFGASSYIISGEGGWHDPSLVPCWLIRLWSARVHLEPMWVLGPKRRVRGRADRPVRE